MNGQKINYKKYKESLDMVGEPTSVSSLPKVRMNLPAMVKYAKSVNKDVSDLTEEEIKQFVVKGYDELQSFQTWKWVKD